MGRLKKYYEKHMFIIHLIIMVLMGIVWNVFIKPISPNRMFTFVWFVVAPFLYSRIVGYALNQWLRFSNKKKFRYDFIKVFLEVIISAGLYYFYRDFSSACLLFIISIILIVSDRNIIECLIAIFLITLVYILEYLNFVVTPKEVQVRIHIIANIIFTVWSMAVAIVMISFENEIKRKAEQAIIELERKEKEARLFYRNLNHAVRTPTNIIIGADEMILREMVTKETTNACAEIAAKVGEVVSIIDSVMTFSKEDVHEEGTEVATSEKDMNYASKYRDDVTLMHENNEHIYLPHIRILIVDDDLKNLAMFTDLMKITGIKVDTAINGTEALKLVSYNYYNMIFMDHLMPDMDGVEALGYIKRHPMANADMSVIAYTANAGDKARDEYIEYGFDDYIAKPATSKQIEDMIKKHLPDYVYNK